MGKTHPQHVVKFFRGGFHIITTDKPTPKENETPIAKMDPKSGSIERTYITWNHPALAKFEIDKDKLSLWVLWQSRVPRLSPTLNPATQQADNAGWLTK